MFLKQNQKELLEEYLKSGNENFKVNLFYSLLPLCHFKCYKIFQRQFYDLPIENGDSYYISYLSYNELIEEYKKYELNIDMFLICLVNKIKQKVLSYCRNFMTLGHKILNNYSEIDNNVYTYCNFIDEKLEWNDARESIGSLLKFANNNTQKKIVMEKMNGFSELEISQKLNISKKRVSNEFYIFKTICKNKVKNRI